jgi:hypothetical protein
MTTTCTTTATTTFRDGGNMRPACNDARRRVS